MITAIEYLVRDGEAIVYRCYGEGSVLEFPETVDGMTIIGMADHCFAAEPSFRLRKEKRYYAFAAEKSAGADNGEIPDFVTDESRVPEDPAMCALQLDEIWLPTTIDRIGDYAFYGCDNLRRLHIPETISHMGGGCFVACNHIRELCFYEPSDLQKKMQREQNSDTLGGAVVFKSNMRDIIGEITYEVEVVSEDSKGNEKFRLVYPEYIEETIENTPARIIEMRYEGSGFRFRQCFQNGRPDFAWYDSMFHDASMTEYPDTLERLIFARLVYPVDLKEKALSEYMDYLSKNAERTADYLAKGQRVEGLQALCDRKFFTKELLDLFLEKASARSWAEAVSILMDYRRKQFPVKKNKYEF